MKTNHPLPPQVSLDEERVRRAPIRFYRVLWILFGALGVLLARLWYLQVAQGEELAIRAESVRTRLLREAAPRGIIQDRNGYAVATNATRMVVSVLPDALRKKPERVRLIADLLNIPASELRDAIENPQINPYVPLVVASDLHLEKEQERGVIARLMERLYNLPEVRVEPRSLRYYPEGKVFAHLIGYVGQISQDELDEFSSGRQGDAGTRGGGDEERQGDKETRRQGNEAPNSFTTAPSLYDGSDFVGKNGLEREYELYLHGVPGGEKIEVTPLGRRVRPLEKIEPAPGANIILTVDARLQKRAYELLQGRVGALVAIDPRNGEVLALVSQPAFDPNLFVGRIPMQLWKSLINDPRYPLQNRAIQSAYPPGSIFKPLNALEGLRNGVLSTHSSFSCRGGVQLGRRFFRCWRRHGSVDFYRAIAQSCDIFFYESARRQGPEALAKVSREFGLGSRTGIDLPHEGRGLVPDPDWKQKTHHEPWYGGETLNFGIGQGYLQVTPLQMAVATAAIANRGVVYRPHVVKRIVGGQVYEVKPEVLDQIKAAPEHWEAVIEGMRRAVTEGTARGCSLPGLSIAGKTGSAEVRKGGKTHAWFIAFAPVENPRVAICVMAEQAGHGGTVAVPITREWLKTFFELGY